MSQLDDLSWPIENVNKFEIVIPIEWLPSIEIIHPKWEDYKESLTDAFFEYS